MTVEGVGGRPTRKQLRQRLRPKEDVAEGSNKYLAPFIPRPVKSRGDQMFNEGQMRKRTLIAMVGEGSTVKDAISHVGVTLGTYEFWRSQDEHFRQAVNYARKHRGTGEFRGQSFVSFRKRYFGFDSYYHHLQIIEAIESAPPMSVTLVLVPPEFGKSTCLVDYVNYKIAQDPNIRITVVSEGEGHAKKFLGRVQRRMTDSEISGDYIAEFGPFKPEDRSGKPWAATHFTVDRASVDQADYTLEARGAGSKIYGTRADLMIFDDIQSRQNLNQTDKLLASIRQDFISRPGRNGRIVFIATRVDVGDVYERMIDEDIVDRLVQLPATNPVEVLCVKALPLCELGHKDCCGLHWADGSVVPHEASMAPEMWDEHSLATRRKQVGNVIWLRSYQQRPQAAGTATFSTEMLDQAKNPIRKVGDRSGFVAMGLDLALGGQNALIAVDLSAERLDVVDLQVDQGLGRVEQILSRVEQFCDLYEPKVLVCETDTLQKGLARDERLREMADHYGFLIHEHRTAGQKADEILGVSQMASTFSRGEISIPFADAYAQRRMQTLLEELAAWRPDVATRNLRQDAVMALWFTWRYWTRHKQMFSGGAETFNREVPRWARSGISILRPINKRAS